MIEISIDFFLFSSWLICNIALNQKKFVRKYFIYYLEHLYAIIKIALINIVKPLEEIT